MTNNIAIVVEDGSGVAGANSYVSIADMVAYALQRGVVLTADDTTAAMLIQASDYLEARGPEYQGYPTTDTQDLQWPRQDVFFTNTAAAAAAGVNVGVSWNNMLVIDNTPPFPNNAIPKQLISAQKMLVMAVNQGIVLMPNIQATDYVISESVGPIKTTYSDPTKSGILPMFSGVDLVLAPLFNVSNVSAFGFQTVRA